MKTTEPASDVAGGRVMRADARRNYERLLSAAAEAFAEHGADDVSLEEIARRAGVGIGTLYRHFPTRRDLLEAVYLDQVQGLRSLADELSVSVPPQEALAAWLRALIDFSRTKRVLTSALMSTVGGNPELMSSCSALLRGAISDVLERAQQAGAVRLDADPTDLMRLTHAISMTTDWSGSDEGQVSRLLAIVLDGLRPER
jgi:AcrR family transcriptional regulator